LEGSNVDPIWNFQNGQVSHENKPISMKHRGLLKLFLEFEKGQVTHENIPIF
jgi:hypothetical protein